MSLRSFVARWREGDVRITNAALAILGFVLILLGHQLAQEINAYAIGYSAVSLCSLTAYLGAVVLVRTQPVDRMTFRIVVTCAIAMHAMTFFADPALSSDIYRYVWDGIVQHHGISPYRYVPGNPILSALRAPNQEIYENINRRDYAVTIYPPLAQMFYWLSTWFSPTIEAMKAMMLGFECLCAYAVVKILERLGRPRAEVLLLIWCPLLVWEIGDAGHVDAIICGFIALAMLFRIRNQPTLTGLALGVAIMVKFYPLLLVPALYQRRGWRMLAAIAGVVVAGYAAYISVGWKVFGFLSGYTKEEGLDTGARYFLLDWARQIPGLHNLPNWSFMLLCAVVLGGLALWAWQHASVETIAPVGRTPLPVPNFMRLSALLALAMMLLFSPHYGWYLLWLVPLMTLAPSLPFFVYVLTFYFGYTTDLAIPGPRMFLLNKYLYVAVAISFALHVAMKRWPVWPYLLSKKRFRDAEIGNGVEPALLAEVVR